MLKSMIKFKIKFEIKFEIIFVKLKLKPNQIQETTAFSFIGHQELRQSLEDQTQETPAVIAASDYSGDAVPTAIAPSQDSSSSFACVHYV